MSVELLHGDCLALLRTLPSDSLDACVTDPPYHLTEGKKGGSGPASASSRTPQGRARIGTGFMGAKWDGGNTAFQVELWAEVRRVLKPGAHLLAFGGTRTWHRMVCAIEDAGFEIRDCIRNEQSTTETWPGWLYGCGMPKSHNVAKAIDRTHGPGTAEAAQWAGWGSSLKPAWEPITVARKPFPRTLASNVLQHGVGGLHIDACRIHGDDAQGGAYTIKRRKPGAEQNRTGGSYRPDDGPDYHGIQAPGRWPANVVHDGSDEVLAAFAAAGSRGASAPASGPKLRGVNTSVAHGLRRGLPDGQAPAFHNGGGSPARFFFSGKAGKADRAGSDHPTVKRVDLLRWLVRLVAQPGSRVLDPFAGSGTLGAACLAEGMHALMMERDPTFAADIRRRFNLDGEGAALPLFAA